MNTMITTVDECTMTANIANSFMNQCADANDDVQSVYAFDMNKCDDNEVGRQCDTESKAVEEEFDDGVRSVYAFDVQNDFIVSSLYCKSFIVNNTLYRLVDPNEEADEYDDYPFENEHLSYAGTGDWSDKNKYGEYGPDDWSDNGSEDDSEDCSEDGEDSDEYDSEDEEESYDGTDEEEDDDEYGSDEDGSEDGDEVDDSKYQPDDWTNDDDVHSVYAFDVQNGSITGVNEEWAHPGNIDDGVCSEYCFGPSEWSDDDGVHSEYAFDIHRGDYSQNESNWIDNGDNDVCSEYAFDMSEETRSVYAFDIHVPDADLKHVATAALMKDEKPSSDPTPLVDGIVDGDDDDLSYPQASAYSIFLELCRNIYKTWIEMDEDTLQIVVSVLFFVFTFIWLAIY